MRGGRSCATHASAAEAEQRHDPLSEISVKTACQANIVKQRDKIVKGAAGLAATKCRASYYPVTTGRYRQTLPSRAIAAKCSGKSNANTAATTSTVSPRWSRDGSVASRAKPRQSDLDFHLAMPGALCILFSLRLVLPQAQNDPSSFILPLSARAHRESARGESPAQQRGAEFHKMYEQVAFTRGASPLCRSY